MTFHAIKLWRRWYSFQTFSIAICLNILSAKLFLFKFLTTAFQMPTPEHRNRAIPVEKCKQSLFCEVNGSNQDWFSATQVQFSVTNKENDRTDQCWGKEKAKLSKKSVASLITPPTIIIKKVGLWCQWDLGSGWMVSLLAWYSDKPISNPAKFTVFIL